MSESIFKCSYQLTWCHTFITLNNTLTTCTNIHIQIPLTSYVVSYIYAVTLWYCKLGVTVRVYCNYTNSYCALQYLLSLSQRTLTATSICSNHSGTVLYETNIASQRNLHVYQIKHIFLTTYQNFIKCDETDTLWFCQGFKLFIDFSW